jgi:hypothetical protein
MKAILPLLLTATLAGGLWAVSHRGEAAAAQPPIPMPSVRPLPVRSG